LCCRCVREKERLANPPSRARTIACRSRLRDSITPSEGRRRASMHSDPMHRSPPCVTSMKSGGKRPSRTNRNKCRYCLRVFYNLSLLCPRVFYLVRGRHSGAEKYSRRKSLISDSGSFWVFVHVPVGSVVYLYGRLPVF
jgi:hypothetical protein